MNVVTYNETILALLICGLISVETVIKLRLEIDKSLLTITLN